MMVFAILLSGLILISAICIIFYICETKNNGNSDDNYPEKHLEPYYWLDDDDRENPLDSSKYRGRFRSWDDEY